MIKFRISEAQFATAIGQSEADVKFLEICRRQEQENTHLNTLVPDLSIDKRVLQDVINNL